MAKQIIILERPSGNRFVVAFWLTVPVARQPFYANASATSRYKDASAGEITALQNGSVVEKVGEYPFDASLTLANVQALLISEYTRLQTELTAFNQWNRYGSFYDGTSWTAGGVA